MLEPIVILTEMLPTQGNMSQSDHIVVGKGKKMPLLLAYGDRFWFFNEAGVKKLRDYLNLILDPANKKETVVDITKPLSSDPANDAKAENSLKKESDGSLPNYM